MKSFFSNIVSSFIGVFLAISALLFVIVILVGGLISTLVSEFDGEQSEQALKTNSVMIVRLNYPIAEKTSEDPFENFDFNTMESRVFLGLDDIVQSIQRSANDPNISGIYLNISPELSGWASIESIRNALKNFKNSGKWIVAYNETYSHSNYYVSSIAHEIYLNPEGFMQFQGLNSQSLFLKDTLAKLDIEMQVLRGPGNEYKSAIETFVNSKMSDNSRFQTQTLINEIWGNTLKNISLSRNVSENQLNSIANTLALEKPSDAVKLKLIDGIRYQDEIRTLIKEKLQISENKKIPVISIENYATSHKSKRIFNDLQNLNHPQQIAVIYADGNIMSGENNRGVVGSITTSHALRIARENKNVKAIVLRVNSPGGSALASEVILRELYLSAQVKPVIASFGNVAASGGYYIATAATKIYAEPSTITGSIGVFSLIPNFKGFLNNKLGISFENVKTNDYSDFGSSTQALKSFEKQHLQKQLKRVYQTFKGHVGQGRSLSEAQVEDIANGRVWTGTTAQKIGLVDELGGLNDAINEAAMMAEISDYQLLKLPLEDTPFNRFLKNTDEQARTWLLNSVFSDSVIGKQVSAVIKSYRDLEQISQENSIQARMPFSITIQ
jgi:protease-4